MPVQDEHHQHSAHVELWSKCRTTIAGEEAVKARRADFLPPLSGQNETQYAS